MNESDLFDVIILAIEEYTKASPSPNPYVVLGVIEHAKLQYAQRCDEIFNELRTKDS